MKSQLIMEQIILAHHPEFQESHLRALARRRPEIFNVERLVEECMALVGGYEFVDQAHYDNSDWSDTKTASISQHDSMAMITNIMSESDQPKVGDLRVIVYNPFYQRLDYYFMPKLGWEDQREYGAANRRRLRARYNRDLDVIPKWQQWRVQSFAELARSQSTVTLPQWGAAKMISGLFEWSDNP